MVHAFICTYTHTQANLIEAELAIPQVQQDGARRVLHARAHPHHPRPPLPLLDRHARLVREHGRARDPPLSAEPARLPRRPRRRRPSHARRDLALPRARRAGRPARDAVPPAQVRQGAAHGRPRRDPRGLRQTHTQCTPHTVCTFPRCTADTLCTVYGAGLRLPVCYCLLLSVTVCYWRRTAATRTSSAAPPAPSTSSWSPLRPTPTGSGGSARPRCPGCGRNSRRRLARRRCRPPPRTSCAT